MFVSILGDSISTYSGFNPPGYAVFYDEDMQKRNGLNSVYDTWWAKVIQELHGHLCINNSYSGSRVSGIEFPAGCSHERIMHLHNSKCLPDLILIYMGFNDFGYGVPLRCAPLSNEGKTNLNHFEDAYHQMLTGLRFYYPNAKIICATLMRTTLNQNRLWHFPDKLGGRHIEEYNAAIRRAANNCNVGVADLTKRHLNFRGFNICDHRYETVDGTHPTANGHQAIADEWIKSLLKVLTQ